MTTRNWDGSSNAFTSAADWSPNGVPGSDDVAIISSGSVSIATPLSSMPGGLTIQLNEVSGATTATTLALNGVTLDSTVTLTVTNNQASVNATAPTIVVTGTSTLAGMESFAGTRTQFTINAGATLINSGTLTFNGSSPLTNGGGMLTNNGTIALSNPTSATQAPVFGDAINGVGQITLGTSTRLEFGASVGAGQTLAFVGGSSGNEIAQLDMVGSFASAITGFSASDLIAVVNTPYTGATYTSTGANSGTLGLYSGTTLEGSLNFTGNYVLSSFTFTFNDFGSGQSNLQITTTGSGTSGSGTGAGSGNGAGPIGTTPAGTTVGAVYRFFDKTNGTHFFTSDVGERNTVETTLASRYTEETNNFGDVGQTDPGAAPVYRFFDTNYGTHFFTASTSERNTVEATRPDLTYEPLSTFYEHATQQSGDVAVYRFFDTQFGTHFYTGDAGEYAGLTTPGTPTYRSNLTYEGVGFYAPAGSFT